MRSKLSILSKEKSRRHWGGGKKKKQGGVFRNTLFISNKDADVEFQDQLEKESWPAIHNMGLYIEKAFFCVITNEQRGGFTKKRAIHLDQHQFARRAQKRPSGKKNTL